MDRTLGIPIILAALLAGLVLQWLVLQLALRPAWLATPNARSLHTTPTPTMGGLAMVVLVLLYLGYLSLELGQLGWGLCTACGALAAVGLWDDIIGVSVKIRIGIHVMAAACILWAMALSAPWWMLIIYLFALVWFINLYNFMDGIDGIAAVQCLVFCVGVELVSASTLGWVSELLWVISGTTLAFLSFNWPPAKIFMGDVGSGFLGLLLGSVLIYLWQVESLPLIAGLILLAVFWFDATYTLCVRIGTGQEFTHAHRSHLYQQLARSRGHLWTTSVFLIYAMGWLMPLAWLSVAYPELQLLCLGAAIAPLAVLCWYFKAGMAEQP